MAVYMLYYIAIALSNNVGQEIPPISSDSIAPHAMLQEPSPTRYGVGDLFFST